MSRTDNEPGLSTLGMANMLFELGVHDLPTRELFGMDEKPGVRKASKRNKSKSRRTKKARRANRR